MFVVRARGQLRRLAAVDVEQVEMLALVAEEPDEVLLELIAIDGRSASAAAALLRPPRTRGRSR